jgi:hypothetical protein
MNSRELVNPANPFRAAYGSVADSTMLISLPGPQALLIHQIFNTLINGTGLPDCQTKIGMSESALDVIFDEFNDWVEAQERDQDEVIVLWDENGVPKSSFERAFSTSEIRSIRNMTEIAMLELGKYDFQTRTGFALTEAKHLLDELNAALLDPLHLDQATEVAH